MFLLETPRCLTCFQIQSNNQATEILEINPIYFLKLNENLYLKMKRKDVKAIGSKMFIH